ncbi:ABC transporter permease subunit [Svornostia abyssi]|uniref:ABC transporter permease subunit n=1 Tax=Svornostia abyssi TaxID=2898438 RepID=A0ABY5PE22_9ACTN|nr:ABC transporter permease subunit [Parviterribacteraceae bacterium J379]
MAEPASSSAPTLARSARRPASRRPALGALHRLRAAAVSGLLALAGVAVVVGIWWLISLGADPVRVPSPQVVFDALVSGWENIPALSFVAFQSGGIKQAVTYTTVNVIVGVGIGASIGFVVGALLGRVRLARELLSPGLFVLSTVPVLVLAPFLTIWFGTARFVQAGLVIVFALVTVAAVTQQATLDVGERYTNYAASLGARRSMLLRAVILPAIVPAAIGGIRVAAAAGWSFATVAELLGGNKGVGKLIQTMQGLSATADIMAAVIALGIVAVLVDAVIRLVGQWVVRWQE